MTSAISHEDGSSQRKHLYKRNVINFNTKRSKQKTEPKRKLAHHLLLSWGSFTL